MSCFWPKWITIKGEGGQKYKLGPQNGTSFIYKINNRGSSVDPCDIPYKHLNTRE